MHVIKNKDKANEICFAELGKIYFLDKTQKDYGLYINQVDATGFKLKPGTYIVTYDSPKYGRIKLRQRQCLYPTLQAAVIDNIISEDKYGNITSRVFHRVQVLTPHFTYVDCWTFKNLFETAKYTIADGIMRKANIPV
jgi:hypothetical protein